MNHFIKLGKDKLEKMEQCDMIYKINCLDCDSSYVGQTKKKAKTRIKEHKANIKRKDSLIASDWMWLQNKLGQYSSVR